MAWLILTLAVAVALLVGVERLLRRLGVARADPADAPRELGEIIDHLRSWWRSR